MGIKADFDQLRDEARQRVCEIREKELNFFIDNLSAIGTSSALLAGFSFYAIVEFINRDRHAVLLGIYFCTQTLSMIFGLISLLNATLCIMFGPGLAYRGPDKGMEYAVKGLEIERNITFWYFKLANIFYVTAACLWVWLGASTPTAVVSTFILSVFLILFYKYNHSIYQRFKIPETSEGLDFERRI